MCGRLFLLWDWASSRISMQHWQAFCGQNTMESETKWLYIDGSGSQKGPVPSSVLVRLFEKGINITQDTMVWTSEMVQWDKFCNVPEFKQIAQLMSKTWYYLDADGQQRGPLLSKLLLHKIQQGEIDGLTMVFGEGLSAWKQLMDVPELKEASAKAAQEEEATHAVMSALPEDAQVFEGESGHMDDPFALLTAVGNAAATECGVEEDKKYFIADDGVRYMWDKKEQEWVEDDEPLESDNDEDGGKSSQRRDRESGRDESGVVGEAEVGAEGDEDGGATEGHKRKRKKRKKKSGQEWNASASKMWVYISGLPVDVTVDELKAHFSKVGIIAISPLDQQPKIKLYRDEQGNPKGDASICYIAEASVDMAVSVLDGGFIRPMSKPLSVSRAEFQKKDGTQGEGEGTGVAWKKPRQNLTHAQVKVTQNAIAQALAWNEDDDLGVSKKRALKIVVLEGMFRPEDSLSDPTFFEDLERDLLQECEKLGEIEKITVFSKNPRGIVIIKFSTSFAAQECVRVMDGRFFGGNRLRCTFWDGVTNYSVPDMSSQAGVNGSAALNGTAVEAAEEARLDAFGDWLDKDQEDLPEEFRLRVE